MSDSYPFDPTFERAVVALLVTSARFWSRVGPHIDPQRLNDKKSRLLAEVAAEVYESTGKPPGSEAIVLQRLRQRHERGKLNMNMMAACADYLMDAYDAGVPDAEVAIPEVAAVLKRIKQQSTLDSAFVKFAERGDLTEIAAELQAVEGIGKDDASYGVGLDDFGQEIDQLGQVERLPIGFRELDAETGGGTARGEFWFWLAGSKVGKTMALVQNGAIGFMRGLFVCAPTLELDTVKWRARLLGTVTGTPYQDILARGSDSVAFERLKEMHEDDDFNLGLFKTHKFSGHQTKLAELLDWVKREEDKAKRQVDVLVIDYADKLVGRNEKDGTYEQMRDVYEGIRLFCEGRNAWGWSASQAQRIALGEMPTINHCADSQHKFRVTDGMIGITRLPDDENKVRAKILGMRNGTGDGAEAGPLPNGFDYGCFVRNVATGVAVENALKRPEGDDLGIFS